MVGAERRLATEPVVIMASAVQVIRVGLTRLAALTAGAVTGAPVAPARACSEVMDPTISAFHLGERRRAGRAIAAGARRDPGAGQGPPTRGGPGAVRALRT